jgi:acyl carrier protein
MKDFDDYASILLEIFHKVEHDGVSRSADLYEEIGLDSLQTFELIVLSEQMAGLMIPPVEIPAINSMGDAYDYYVQCVRLAGQLN